MSAVNNAADSVAPPVDASVHVVDTGAAAATQLSKAEFAGRWLTLQCETAAVYYNYSAGPQTGGPGGVGGITIDETVRDTTAANGDTVATTQASAVIQPGETQHMDLRNIRLDSTEFLFLNHKSDIGGGEAGVLRFWVSDGNVL